MTSLIGELDLEYHNGQVCEVKYHGRPYRRPCVSLGKFKQYKAFG